MEKYIDHLQKYLDETYDGSFGVTIKEYELYQQAFYAACWELAKKDDRGCWDEMEARDEWLEVCMKRAEEALKILKKGE